MREQSHTFAFSPTPRVNCYSFCPFFCFFDKYFAQTICNGGQRQSIHAKNERRGLKAEQDHTNEQVARYERSTVNNRK